MARTVQLSDDRYHRLVQMARDRGFEVKSGPGSQLGDFVEWLLDNAPQPLEGDTPTELWGRFLVNILPHLNDLAAGLADRGHGLDVQAAAQDGHLILNQSDF